MDFSTILKFLGILVSGALGILGTVTETRNKRTGRLTPWGRWALSLTLAGAIVALGAQVFDTLNQRHQEATQTKTTNRLLRNLLRISTKFSEIDVDLICQFSPIDTSITNLFMKYDSTLSANSVGYRLYQVRTGIVAEVHSESTETALKLARSRPMDIRLGDGVYEAWLQRGVSQETANDLKSLLLRTRSTKLVFSDPQNKNYKYVVFNAEPANDPDYITYYNSNNILQLTLHFVLTSAKNKNSGFSSFSDLPKGDVSLGLYGQFIGDPLLKRFFETNATVTAVTLHSGDFSWHFEHPKIEIITPLVCAVRLGTNALGDLQELGY
jgi:hypothetical protein